MILLCSGNKAKETFITGFLKPFGIGEPYQSIVYAIYVCFIFLPIKNKQFMVDKYKFQNRNYAIPFLKLPNRNV